MNSSYQIIRREANEQLLFPSSIPKILQRVYAARDIENPDDIHYALNKLVPADFVGIEKAINLLINAIQQNQHILIVGDYDVDGATSTALMIRALRGMGAKRVDYLLPNRFEYGYGLSAAIVEVAKQSSPDLIITVDNGISSIEGVKAAKAAGISVLITDHHLPADVLPEADAIINPNLPNELFPSKHLAGVGVVFYLLMALRRAFRDAGWFEAQRLPEPNLAQYLDLVALGTVADVVSLDYNNRILVDQGLKRIRAGQCIAGISALLKVGQRKQQDINASDLGFVLGPRLNAAGRLDDMSVGVECLLADDHNIALNYASSLDQINKERKAIEKEMQEQAFATLKTTLNDIEQEDLPAGLCFYDPSWHQGVVGIVASRVKDKTHRPVIVFAPAGDEDISEIKGSARSVSGFHIRDALDAIAAKYPDMISKFGGHAMAAGLSLPLVDFERFKTAFAQEAQRQLGENAGQAVLYSDGELEAQELNISNAELLRAAGPWGKDFPEPLFDGEFEVLNHRIVGGAHLKLQLAKEGCSTSFDAIAFNDVGELIESGVSRIRVVYHLTVNEFNRKRNVQLDVRYYEAVEAT